MGYRRFRRPPLFAARRELSIRGRIIEFDEISSKIKKWFSKGSTKKTVFRFAHPASANNRHGHLQSIALIDIEFGEFRQKLKNLEFRKKSIFCESLGAIWIDPMSFGVVPVLSFFFMEMCQLLMEM